MTTTSRQDLLNGRIYVAGHRGLAGSALVRRLQAAGASKLITRTHAELDLTERLPVSKFFAETAPEYVFLAAAKVGGILANSEKPVEFLQENLAIQANVISEAYHAGVKRLLFLGSSCVYPRDCPQPIHESYLLTGALEATNRSYAIAKISGIELCSAYNRQYGARFLSAMPTNLYGPNDNYDLLRCHVLPALVRKVHEAKEGGAQEVTVWGTGTVRREFIHADDMADASIFLMSLPDEEFGRLINSGVNAPIINVGCGSDMTIRELADRIVHIIGFEGLLVFDTTKPDGTPRKLLDVSRLHALGWRSKIDLEHGLRATYEDFRARRVPRVCGSIAP